VLLDALDETVVGVRALVQAAQPLEARILGDPQSHAVLAAQLLQLGHDLQVARVSRQEGRKAGRKTGSGKQSAIPQITPRAGSAGNAGKPKGEGEKEQNQDTDTGECVGVARSYTVSDAWDALCK